MKKRILSMLLALTMLVGMIPATSLTAYAAGPTVTWTNKNFSTQQNLEDGTVLELVGDNVITIGGAVKPNHNNDFCGIKGINNLTIQGSGTLTINMKPTDVVSGYDIDRLELDGINASHLTIKGNVTIVINIEGAAHDIDGIAANTVSVEDAANLDITVKNTKEHAGCTGIFADTWASLTSTGTTDVNISVNSTSSYKLGDGILVSGMNIEDTNNGDLTIKNGTVNVSFDNNARGYGFFGAAIIASTYATDGSLLIENATVNTTANSDGKQYVAIQECSNAKSTDPTLIVRNSTLNLRGNGLNGGLASWYNGIHLDNSNVTVNCQNDGGGHTLQAEFLKISGGKEVSLKTSCENPVWVPPTKGYIEFALTSGGKFTAESTKTSTYDMNYVKLGTDNYVTSGSVDYSNNYNGDTSIGFATTDNKKFVVEYQDRTTDYVAVDDIDLPEAYTNPDFTYDTSDVAPSRKHWDVVQVEWFECDKDGKKLSDALPADHIFEKGGYYRIEVTVVPETNWQFHGSDLSFYINGKAAMPLYGYNKAYTDSVTGYVVYNTADIEGDYELYVYNGGKDIYIKDGQYLGSDATAPSNTKPSGGYAYYKDGVLELNGYDNEKAHFIFEERALELWLIGDNTIGAIYDNEWGMAGGNLEVRQGNLVINANLGGKLVIASNPLDAYANIQVKDLYFKGGDVTSCLANGTYGAAVQLNGDNLYLEKGTAAYVSDTNDFATATKWDGTTDISNYDCVWLKTLGTYQVVFIDDDNTVLDMVRVTVGSTVSEPEEPVKDGYTFLGWYTDDGDKFDFTTPITEDIYLTAKFEDATSNITVNCIGDIDYTVSGNVVTVDHEVACKVGYLDGTAYKAITAVANGDGTYSFTAPAGVTEVLLVVKGDINGDGEISLADSTRTKAAYNKKTTPTAEAAFAADANGDGEITLADSTRIKAAYNKKTTLSW